MADDGPRLTIELVPATCFVSNLRHVLRRKDWDTLRRQTYQAAGHRCGVCGGHGTTDALECHEVWEYDDHRHVQRLQRLAALCPACHRVKHMGLTVKRGLHDEALTHLASVNGWSLEHAVAYAKQAFAEWRARSEHGWVLDLERLRDYGIDPGSVEVKSRSGRKKPVRQPEGIAEASRSPKGSSFLPEMNEATGESYWTCAGCGSRGVGAVNRVDPADLAPEITSFFSDLQRRAPHLRAVAELTPPAGWRRQRGKLLCESCASPQSAT